MSNEVVLSIQHLSKWYGATRGIEDISFDVYKGEVFGFLGPNGAGKTTTIRTLLGLVKPSGGTATILGLNAFEHQLELRKRIGYLPGLASTYNNYTARGYLRFIAKMRGLNLDSEIETYGSRLKLELDIHIHDLSKGNKQKVSVIQAFMHKPEILFLDEPTSGLDPLVQREFEAILDETKARGGSVVLSSHVLSEVEHLAGRVAIINQGKIVLVDEISRLKSRAVRKIEFTFGRDVKPEEVADIPSVTVLDSGHHRLLLEIKGSEQLLMQRVVELGATEVRTHESTLEEIFIELVGAQ